MTYYRVIEDLNYRSAGLENQPPGGQDQQQRQRIGTRPRDSQSNGNSVTQPERRVPNPCSECY